MTSSKIFGFSDFIELRYECSNKRRMILILSFFNVSQAKYFPLKNKIEKIQFENNGRINSRLSISVTLENGPRNFEQLKLIKMQHRLFVN